MLGMGGIMLTEYDPTFRTVLRSALCSAGYLVEALRSGVQAIECARRMHADLVILDGLLEAKGLKARTRIRELNAYGGVPILVTSWNKSAMFRDQAQRAGVTQLLVKPFSRVEFLARVHDFIRSDEDTARGCELARSDFLGHRRA